MYFRRYFSQPWIGLAMVLLLAGFFASAVAQNKTTPTSPALPEMIARANALTDLSAIGPYEFHARIVVEPGSSHSQQGEITIYRDQARSRMELQLGDFHQVEIVSEGTRYVSRSRPYPLAGLDVLNAVEDAVQLPEQFLADAKIKNRSRTVAGVAASCFDAKRSPVWKTHFCFDSRTGALLEASDYSGWRGRFSGYTAVEEKSFPTKIELTQPGEPRHIELSNIQVTSKNFDDASFAAPQGALAFPVCDAMARAWTATGPGWTIPSAGKGEVYLYAIVEADGSVHDLSVYGGHNKGLQRKAAKLVRDWNFIPARCGRTDVASEVLLPLVRMATYWGSTGTSSDSYSTSSASSLFDRPQNLNTDINNYINTVNDH
jgi:hypothetical protein